MSHHRHREVPGPSSSGAARSKCKRLRTKRERDAAKFGPKAPLGGSRGPPRWLQPPPWRALALGSPLGAPRPVVITENRLCHRGLFNHEVKSRDVRRRLSPGPGGDGPPAPAPQTEEGEAGGGVSGEALRELVAGLASLLGGFGVFVGRELVSERRRSLVAALRRHRRGPPDLGVFLAHRTPAQRPGQGSPRKEARAGPPGRAVSLGGWEVGDPPAGTPSPPRAGRRLPLPPRTPSPIFGALRERENPFSWSSAEDEEDETPGGLPRPWGGPGGLLPPAPPFWRSPQPPQEEEEGGAEGWPPIAPPAFSPPEGPPQSRAPRAPRPPRAPSMWRTETPWDPPGPSGSPWDAPRPLWDSPPRTPPSLLWDPPDPARAPPTPPRASRAPQIWSPVPRKAPPDPLWDPPNPSGPPWDPRPWSPELPAAVLDPPRTPQLWNPEPPRAPWDPPAAPGPLWGSPDPPRAPRDPRPWSPAPPWDPPRAPRDPPRDPRPWSPPELPWDPPRAPRDPPRDPRPWSPEPPWDPPALLRDPPRAPRAWSPPEPPAAPQRVEPSRCCCRRLCRDMAQRQPLGRDPPCHHSARRDPSCRDPSCRDPSCRDPSCRDPSCRDPLPRAPPRPAALCRDPPCRDAPRCSHQPPKRRRRECGGVGGRPWGSPPCPPRPGGCGCRCRGGTPS